MDFFVSSTAVIKQKTNQRSLSNMNKRSKRAQDNDIKQTPSADVIKKINNCHLSNVSVWQHRMYVYMCVWTQCVYIKLNIHPFTWTMGMQRCQHIDIKLNIVTGSAKSASQCRIARILSQDQQRATPQVAEKKSVSVEVYEKMTLLHIWIYDGVQWLNVQFQQDQSHKSRPIRSLDSQNMLLCNERVAMNLSEGLFFPIVCVRVSICMLVVLSSTLGWTRQLPVVTYLHLMLLLQFSRRVCITSMHVAQ